MLFSWFRPACRVLLLQMHSGMCIQYVQSLGLRWGLPVTDNDTNGIHKDSDNDNDCDDNNNNGDDNDNDKIMITITMIILIMMMIIIINNTNTNNAQQIMEVIYYTKNTPKSSQKTLHS